MSADLDYTGQHGGLLAMAFAGGAIAATAFWMTVAGFIWRVFIEKRISALETQLKDERAQAAAERAAEAAECEQRVDGLKNRIIQLETMLMLHGPQALRQAMQAVASEAHLAIDEIRQDKREKGE